MIKMANKRILFRGKRWASGRTPQITIYDPSGNKVIDSENMTELDSRGLYYYDYTSLVNGNYFAYALDGTYHNSATVKIGLTSTQRVYYPASRWKSGLTDVKIDVYNPSGTKIVNNQIMTELDSLGIYYYDVSTTTEGNYAVVMDCVSIPRKDEITLDYYPSEYTINGQEIEVMLKTKNINIDISKSDMYSNMNTTNIEMEFEKRNIEINLTKKDLEVDFND